jgi:hypothetical protein
MRTRLEKQQKPGRTRVDGGVKDVYQSVGFLVEQVLKPSKL